MALAYLLSPTFEFVNTAGKPVTGGHLEVYISGTRDKYYCASDFDGTLHPFRIPLDSLGANVVLAEEGKAYDVYCYNRYGGLLMSRYGIKPGAGGSASVESITSTDGSIIVTDTENGVDLSVNSEPPTSMRCSGEDLLVDGTFQFAELERDGLNASVYNHNVLLNKGWWHYDATVRLQWNGSSNATTPVQLYSAGSSNSMEFDLSYAHSETVQVSGEQKVNADGTQFVLGVTGIPTGMRVSLVDFGIHSITGEGAGGTYYAGSGIVINESDRLISVDTDTIQEKLTAGSNIVIEDNVISATAEPQQQADWTQSDSTAVDYIKHKPDLSTYATDAELTAGLATKQDVISDLSDIRAGASAGATAVQPGDLATVATSGNYADLTNKPTIPTVDQTYSPSSTNAQSGTAVAGALAGINEVPASSSTDEGKVLTVDSSGNPGWAAAQAPISAGDGIDITNNVISVDVDGGSLTNGANGLSVTLPVPATTGASQGDVLSVGSSGLEWTTPATGSVADVEVDGTSVVNASGVAEITMPTVPSLKELVAGSNITITEGTTNVTIAASVPTIGTITL